MTVKELKEFLKTQPDNAILVIHGEDHSYLRVRASESDAELGRLGSIHEYSGDEYMSSKSVKIKVLIMEVV